MSPEELYSVRHSLSHVLAMAVLEVFPEAKLAIGPPIDNGFYYDFDLPRSIEPADLPDLEKRMRRIVGQKLVFTGETVSIDEAKQRLQGQPYKLELVEDLQEKGETAVTFYTSGSFTDLCKGDHVENTGSILADSFVLTHAAGAYWRGDEKRPMLQRIYGLAFATAEDLREYRHQQEEAKKRDHRVLGPQLGIYMLSEAVGAGLPLWLPKGETVKHLLKEYMRSKEEAAGYQYVESPVIAHEELYKRSGHAQYYAEDMYSFKDAEGHTFYMKPMNCPHHHMMFDRLTTSYRDLPIRLAEAGGVYRKELSGTLTGLIRVRGTITQNDAHVYVTPDQLKGEFMAFLDLFKEVYGELGIEGYWFRLSLPDFAGKSVKYGGDQAVWENASQVIREVLEESGVPFVEAVGEAAFYGPKVDIQIRNVTGKEDTIATSQIDILVPQRMGLQYIDEAGTAQTPIVIHRAILGSYERFTAFLIEQTAGNFPLWLAPVQVKVISVSDAFNDAAAALAEELKAAGLRVEVDKSTESVGKKIRAAALEKVPVKLVVGQREADSAAQGWLVQPNWRKDLEERYGATEAQPLADFLVMAQEIVDRKIR